MTAVLLVPKLSAGARFGYFKFCRKTGEFPEASAAALLDPERRVARLFVGALSGAPQPLTELAAALAARGAEAATADAITAALTAAAPGLDPVERRMQAGTVQRAVARLFA